MSGSSSFEKINYSIRPGKSTQRRMMVEAIGRLAALHPLHKYQYIGFGSTFFIDFKMIHRQYGLRKLISIEKEGEKRKRFNFNKPYSCVDMFYGTAAEYFSDGPVAWTKPMIVWLDYDYRMGDAVLADVERILEKALPGSLVVVTVDAEPPPARERRRELGKELDLGKLVRFAKRTNAGLNKDGLADAYHAYATADIESKLRRARPDCKWRQIFNFRYSDGTRMLTLGGLIADAVIDKKVQACSFAELPYFKSAAEPFPIAVPNLTPAEVHRLAKSMPKPTADRRKTLVNLAIDEEDIRNYELLYRYLPQFVESHV